MLVRADSYPSLELSRKMSNPSESSRFLPLNIVFVLVIEWALAIHNHVGRGKKNTLTVRTECHKRRLNGWYKRRIKNKEVLLTQLSFSLVCLEIRT